MPGKSEFEQFLRSLGGAGEASYKELAKKGTCFFDVLFGGWCYGKGQYGDLGSYADFWSSSEDFTGSAWYLYLGSEGQGAGLGIDYLTFGYLCCGYYLAPS